LFQEVEKLGGMAAALRAEFPQKAVAATAAAKIKAVNDRRSIIVGVNQYVQPNETPLEVPSVDAKLFHKRRAQQIASYRTSLEDAANELVLKRLSNIVNIRGEGLFAECVEAVAAGATLGEIVRAMRIQDHPCAPITPVCLTRAASSIERH
jgi:methylmalonyl-CoA mutase